MDPWGKKIKVSGCMRPQGAEQRKERKGVCWILLDLSENACPYSCALAHGRCRR